MIASKSTRRRPRPPPLRIERILAWADAYHAATGRWPRSDSGRVGVGEETWQRISWALQEGSRTLPGGSSLARLLAERRGVRNRGDLPRLTPARILAWADADHTRAATWPTAESGPIRAAPGETWQGVHQALRSGLRGLPGGSSLAQLLAARRGVRNVKALPRLTRKKIVAWADAHCRRTGRWPGVATGDVADAPGESWAAINNALHRGMRGLRPGSSLARLLGQERGVRNAKRPPPLELERILAWADAHQRRTQRWPRVESGRIPESKDNKWRDIDNALVYGMRSLPVGSSLAKLLAQRRGVRNGANLPTLRIRQILAWADEHRRLTGRWPTTHSGPVSMAAGEKWANINAALRAGSRGLAGGTSLSRLLARSHSARRRAD